MQYRYSIRVWNQEAVKNSTRCDTTDQYTICHLLLKEISFLGILSYRREGIKQHGLCCFSGWSDAMEAQAPQHNVMVTSSCLIFPLVQDPIGSSYLWDQIIKPTRSTNPLKYNTITKEAEPCGSDTVYYFF